MSRKYDYYEDECRKCDCYACVKKQEKPRCKVCEEYKKHKKQHYDDDKPSCKSTCKPSYKQPSSHVDNKCLYDSSSDKESVNCEEQPSKEIIKYDNTKCDFYNKDNKSGKYVVITINSFGTQDLDYCPKSK